MSSYSNRAKKPNGAKKLRYSKISGKNTTFVSWKPNEDLAQAPIEPGQEAIALLALEEHLLLQDDLIKTETDKTAINLYQQLTR